MLLVSEGSPVSVLLCRGPARGWYQRSRILQVQACLRMVLDWARKAGLAHLTDKFLAKFRSAVSILTTPLQQLLQMSWKSLSLDHPSLKPVQLHRILTQYQLAAGTGPVTSWQPGPDEETHIYKTVDLLESFENHPPIVLPSSGFRVDLDCDAVDENIYRQLLYVRHFLWGLRTKSPSTNGSTDWQEPQREPPQSQCSPRPAGPRREGEADGKVSGVSAPSGVSEERLREKLQQMPHSLRRNGPQRTLDPSCLLTPPNTPLYPEHPQLNGCSRTPPDIKKANGFIANGLEVELDKGPFGLGMGLIDGLHTPLNSPGIYIRTLIPDGPAASDGRLRIGDRILAVNGTSLIGADYQSAVDLIRLGGGRLRFLVAKSDLEVSEKISASSC